MFIQDLYRLSDNCQYGTLRDELIRDRIVVAVLDEALSDRMQTQATLTLDQAVQLSRQSEARKQQRDVIRGDTASKANIDFVKKAKPRVQSRPLADAKCKWRGRQPHSRQQCPAKEAKCNNCIGHFRLVCRSVKPNEKSVHKVDAQNIEDVFLGEVRNNSDNSWSVDLTVDSYKVNFKLDTGAAVSVLSDTEPLLHRYTLCDTSQRLRGASGMLLPVLGTVRAKLGYNGKTCTETLYVTLNQQHSLLGRDACHKLDLITVNVNEVQDEFPKLFHGLGKLQTKHHITLTNNAQPVCLFAPRKVQHPLLQKVNDQLARIETQGVIPKITEPTEWCSGMVVVPKSDGRVRICVDLTGLNKAVKREIHQMHSVDETLAKLGDVRVFSKLDANSGFWQLPLDDESKRLTTFITTVGNASSIVYRSASRRPQKYSNAQCRKSSRSRQELCVICWFSHQMQNSMMSD